MTRKCVRLLYKMCTYIYLCVDVCSVYVYGNKRRKEKQITALLSTSQRCRTVITHMCDADASFRFVSFHSVLCTMFICLAKHFHENPILLGIHFEMLPHCCCCCHWFGCDNNSGEFKNQGIRLFCIRWHRRRRVLFVCYTVEHGVWEVVCRANGCMCVCVYVLMCAFV